MDNLAKRIALEKLTDGTRFSTGELAEVQANRALASELQLNRLLANEAHKRSINQQPTPDRPETLAAATHRGENERSYYRRRAIMLAVRKCVPVAATVLVVAIALMLGTILGPSKIAWATVDGYLLEYKLEFDEHFSGTAVDAPDHPILQIERALAQWNAGHVQTGGAPIAEMEITRYGKTFEQPKYECDFQFRLLSDSDDLLKSLRAAMAVTGILSEPEVYSDTWYYSEKFPESYYSGRTVVINDKEFVYPTDFISDELSDIRGLIFFSPNWEGEAYFGFYQLGDGERIELADVVVVRNMPDGVVSISDVVDVVDRGQFNLLSYTKYVSAQVTASERGLDFDPVELLKANYQQKMMMDMGGWSPINFRGYRLVVDLSGEPGAMVAGLDAAVLDWAKDYPEVLPGNDAEMLLESGTVEVKEEPVEWQVTFWRTDKELATEIKGCLEQEGFEVKRMTLVVTTEEESERVYYAPRRSHQGMASPEFNAHYILLDGRDEHGTNPFYFTEELTKKKREEARALSNQMEDVFEDWLENINEQNIDYGGFLPSFHKQTAPRLSEDKAEDTTITGFSVSTSVTEENFNALLDAFAKLGAPEPRVTNRSDFGQHPRGFSATFTLIHGKQLQGVTEADSTSIFSAAGLEAHMELLNGLEEVASKWVEKNKDLVADESKPLKVMIRRQRYGELPVHLFVNTSIRQQEDFDDLVSALKDAGAPAPVVGEARPNGIPVIRGNNETPRYYADQILAYYFRIPAIMLYMSHEEEMWDMLTDEEVTDQRATIQRMKSALAEWNLANPSGEGETPVKFSSRDRLGIVYEASLQSDRMDRETMESLAAAMALEGVPDYHYGVAYQRPAGRQPFNRSQPSIRVYGSSLGFNLIPLIYWNGEMQKNITREMRQDAQEKYNQALDVLWQWWKSHPELNQLERGATVVEPSIEMPLSPQIGMARFFQVQIWSNDEEYRRTLMAELEELFSAVEGLPDFHVSHNRIRGG